MYVRRSNMEDIPAMMDLYAQARVCLLYTSDAADEEDSGDLGGPQIIKKKKNSDLDIQKTLFLTFTLHET